MIVEALFHKYPAHLEFLTTVLAQWATVFAPIQRDDTGPGIRFVREYSGDKDPKYETDYGWPKMLELCTERSDHKEFYTYD